MGEISGDVGDTIAGLVVIGAVSDILPPIAAIFAILWTSIRIYEWFCFRVLGRQGKGAYK